MIEKKFEKKICSLKKGCTFAATYILRGGRNRLYAAGIFYALSLLIICGSAPPCWSVNAPTASQVYVNGKGGTVFYFCPNNFICMTYTEKTASKVKHSSRTSTPDRESVKVRSLEDFEIEKNAKNKAYYFILSNGLLSQFTEFCKNYDSDDPFGDIINLLTEKGDGN